MIRLGVIGHGNRVSEVIRSCFRAVEPEVRVVGIVDPDRDGARGRLAECDRADARFYGSLAELVRGARPDGLVVGTRCNLHAPLAAEAAAYDIPLFLEKPVATSMEQARALEGAFAGSRCPVVVSFPLRVSPLCVMARRAIEEGRVGAAEHVMAVNYVPYGTVYFDAFYRDFAVTQGLFLQKATHDLDYLMFLMGSPITRVAAMQCRGRVFGGTKPAGLFCSACGDRGTCPESPGNRRRNRSGGDLEDHACVFGSDIGSPAAGMNEDSSSALLEFASGAHGVYTQVFFSRRDAAARGATVSGYRGTVSFDWYRNEMRYVRHHEPFTDATRAGEGMSHFGGDLELAHDFIGLVKGTTSSRTPIKTGLQSVYACLAAKESAETGRFVAVRQVGAAS
jgi:predicted dehydrogenase